MSSPLVTVIIPVYNTKKYIADCINSVFNQTYDNLEIILINDGSTDDSALECNKFASDKRVRFVDRENRGLSVTRQQGIDMAAGEYFCNLDSDDMLDEHFVEKMIACAAQTGADIVTCGRKDFDVGYEKNRLLTADQTFYSLNRDFVSVRFHQISAQLWLADSWNKLYRTDFVRATGVKYWLNNKYNGTDLSFNHLLCMHCPQIAVVNEPLVLHRMVVGSRVHRKNKPLLEGFQLIAERQICEAQKMGYGQEFFETYKFSYYAFLKMAFEAILSESENSRELRRRWREDRDSVNKFAETHSAFSCENLKNKLCYGFDRIVHKAMLSPKVLWCIIAHNAYRLRRWKNRKQGNYV